MTILLIIILNAVLISTTMCLADRINHRIGVFKKRSFCLQCNHPLHYYDLIPLFSALYTRGHCRYCHAKFGLHYAFFEFFGTLIASYFMSEIIIWITFYLLLFLSLEDWHNERIHADILLPWICYLLIDNWNISKFFALCTILIISLFLVYYRHAMGSGDIPILLIITLITPIQGLALTLLFGSVSALIYLQTFRVKHLPFVPFLYFGWLTSLLIQKVITMHGL